MIASFTSREAAVRGAVNVFVPALLFALAITGGLAFQTVQLALDRQHVAQLRTEMELPGQNAVKLRGALDTVATATSRLAADGNANARVVVDELRRRGVTINAASAQKPP